VKFVFLILILCSCVVEQNASKANKFFAEIDTLEIHRSDACEEGNALVAAQPDLVQFVRKTRHFDKSLSGELAPRFDRPLVFSPKALEEEAATIALEIEQVLGVDWKDINREEIFQRATDVEQGAKSLDALISSARSWVEKRQRLEEQTCALSKMGRINQLDLRPYLRLKTGVKSDWVRNDLMAICGSFRSRSVCEAELALLEKKGDVDKFSHHYLRKFEQKHYQRYFKQVSGEKFRCFNENNRKIMQISVEVDPSLFSFEGYEIERMLRLVGKYWSDDQREVRLIQAGGAGDIKIVRSENSASYVISNEPTTIHLSPTTLGFDRVRVVAHELGHVFGFPDCYVQFYDNSIEGFLYYELEPDQGNLMCTLSKGAKILNLHREGLFNSRCQP
jgi:hypothetical protein